MRELTKVTIEYLVDTERLKNAQADITPSTILSIVESHNHPRTKRAIIGIEKLDFSQIQKEEKEYILFSQDYYNSSSLHIEYLLTGDENELYRNEKILLLDMDDPKDYEKKIFTNHELINRDGDESKIRNKFQRLTSIFGYSADNYMYSASKSVCGNYIFLNRKVTVTEVLLMIKDDTLFLETVYLNKSHIRKGFNNNISRILGRYVSLKKKIKDEVLIKCKPSASLRNVVIGLCSDSFLRSEFPFKDYLQELLRYERIMEIPHHFCNNRREVEPFALKFLGEGFFTKEILDQPIKKLYSNINKLYDKYNKEFLTTFQDRLKELNLSSNDVKEPYLRSLFSSIIECSNIIYYMYNKGNITLEEINIMTSTDIGRYTVLEYEILKWLVKFNFTNQGYKPRKSDSDFINIVQDSTSYISRHAVDINSMLKDESESSGQITMVLTNLINRFYGIKESEAFNLDLSNAPYLYNFMKDSMLDLYERIGGSRKHLSARAALKRGLKIKNGSERINIFKSIPSKYIKLRTLEMEMKLKSF